MLTYCKNSAGKYGIKRNGKFTSLAFDVEAAAENHCMMHNILAEKKKYFKLGILLVKAATYCLAKAGNLEKEEFEFKIGVENSLTLVAAKPGMGLLDKILKDIERWKGML